MKKAGFRIFLHDFYHYFTRGERALWCCSIALVLVAFIIFDRRDYMTLTASLVGVTFLILDAKANPIGQVLMVVFSLLYGAISFHCAYYGEMITYLGMTAPMSVFALVSWLRHPFEGDRSQVRVRGLRAGDGIITLLLCGAVTLIFFFILRAMGTANLVPGTISVATSFLAVALTYLRSPLFALAYAANDAVLIVLWVMAGLSEPSYLSVAVCFGVFLVNDSYTYINWRRLKRQQGEKTRA